MKNELWSNSLWETCFATIDKSNEYWYVVCFRDPWTAHWTCFGPKWYIFFRLGRFWSRDPHLFSRTKPTKHMILFDFINWIYLSILNVIRSEYARMHFHSKWHTPKQSLSDIKIASPIEIRRREGISGIPRTESSISHKVRVHQTSNMLVPPNHIWWWGLKGQTAKLANLVDHKWSEYSAMVQIEFKTYIKYFFNLWSRSFNQTYEK